MGFLNSESSFGTSESGSQSDNGKKWLSGSMVGGQGMAQIEHGIAGAFSNGPRIGIVQIHMNTGTTFAQVSRSGNSSYPEYSEVDDKYIYVTRGGSAGAVDFMIYLEYE